MISIRPGDGAPPAPSPSELERCTELLETLAADRGLLASLDREARQRLLIAAGRLSRPERADLRDLAKALRRKERRQQKAADERVLAATGMREQRRAPVFSTPSPTARLEAHAAAAPAPELERPRKCYVCKAEFRKVHFFYDSMCAACADFNYEKRTQTASLAGRVALITGARVKIGYQAAIMLLRAGARVVVTTRFPHDAALRFSAEPDFGAWGDRLDIHGLDLRHTPSVETFALDLAGRLERLDVIIHNAAQTVRRPPGFYGHLMEVESRPAALLPPSAGPLLRAHEDLLARSDTAGDGVVRLLGLRAPAQLSQLACAPDDARSPLAIFPAGQLDADLQQVDSRETNSWRLALGDVPTVELLEVQLVNAIAPFVLSSKLKPLMVRHPTFEKHIVNVSAVEGQFYRQHKTDKHPHTNMAKAALNMLTRTSAADYARDGIFMNSVDTGWVTDEDPLTIAARKTEEHGFHPPLDIVDGAARICDPIFSGLRTGRHAFGKFFKDYMPCDW